MHSHILSVSHSTPAKRSSCHKVFDLAYLVFDLAETISISITGTDTLKIKGCLK